jgi:hypothetical protein
MERLSSIAGDSHAEYSTRFSRQRATCQPGRSGHPEIQAIDSAAAIQPPRPFRLVPLSLVPSFNASVPVDD